MVFDLVLANDRPSSTFGALDLLLRELFPFFLTFLCRLLRCWLSLGFYLELCLLQEVSFPDFFSVVFCYIDVKFGIWTCIVIIKALDVLEFQSFCNFFCVLTCISYFSNIAPFNLSTKAHGSCASSECCISGLLLCNHCTDFYRTLRETCTHTVTSSTIFSDCWMYRYLC